MTDCFNFLIFISCDKYCFTAEHNNVYEVGRGNDRMVTHSIIRVFRVIVHGCVTSGPLLPGQH